jgi:hypothetical protein
MHTNLKISFALTAITFLSFALTGCSTSTAKSSSSSGNTPKVQPSLTTAPTFNLDLSVEAAYAAIPHRRTVMDFGTSSIPDDDKRFLEVAFHVIDQAIRLRVTAFQKFSRGNRDPELIAEMETLIEYLRGLETPDGLSTYQSTLLKALLDQQSYFKAWQTEGQQFQYANVGSDPRVQSASNALRTAYGILMEKYPNETASNKEAFFDYHCALDFI